MTQAMQGIEVLRAKTGWDVQGNLEVGWYVGYVETGGNVYYFANCRRRQQEARFRKAGKAIAFQILAQLASCLEHVGVKAASSGPSAG